MQLLDRSRTSGSDSAGPIVWMSVGPKMAVNKHFRQPKGQYAVRV